MSKIINKQDVFKYKKELADFLEEHPHMVPFQKEIDEALRKAGSNPHNRMTVLQAMMYERARKLVKCFDDIKKECKNLDKIVKEIRDEQD